MNMSLRPSQLQINEEQYQGLTNGVFGCPSTTYDPTNPLAFSGGFVCTGTPGVGLISGKSLNIQRNLQIVPGTNYVPRMSTGLELQVIMPIVNAPFRVYYAYNPLRLDTMTTTPTYFTRAMFPQGQVGDYNYAQANASYGTNWLFREPRKTFRFTVSTTF